MCLKVNEYTIYEGQQLVFKHTGFPGAGIQVSGVDYEAAENAVLREVEEKIVRKDFKVFWTLWTIIKDSFWS